MSIIFIILGLIALIVSIAPLGLVKRLRKYVTKELTREKRCYIPKVTIIAPCKGKDEGLDENLKLILDQDYPDFEVLFITASEDDPAYPVIEKLIVGDGEARLITAGKLYAGRSEKLNNQLKGLQEMRPETEVVVFVDSDARMKKDFLKNLIEPLQDPAIGVTTGYRWYLPMEGNIPSILRSIWNGGGLAVLTNDKSNIAWGGAMAIRKELFEKLGVKEAWAKSLSDDLMLTRLIKEKGLKIKFIPQCLVVTKETISFGGLLEWTNRQQTILRIYQPKLWWTTTLFYGINNLFLILGIYLLALTGITELPVFIAGLLMLSALPLEVLNSFTLLEVIKPLIKEEKKQITKTKLLYCILTPIVPIILFINTCVSAFSTKIKWRGSKYQIKSPTEIILISR